jgi:hypothetical protein
VGAASSLSEAGASGATAGLLGRFLFWKWIGLGMLSGAVAIGAYRMTVPSHGKVPAVANVTASVAELALPVSAAPLIARRARVEILPISRAASPPSNRSIGVSASVPALVMAAPVLPLESSSAAPSLAASAASPKAPGLGEEIAVLDEARRSMTAGEPSAALRTLERHTRDFPASQLDHEAAVLRVESMLAQGQCDAARAHAGAFLRANPRSPVAPRMNTLLSKPYGATVR